MNFIARVLDRASAHPAPDQHHVLVGSVIEAMPAAARRIDHIACARRLIAGVVVDHALALEDNEKPVAIAMPMVLVPRAWFEHGPTDNMVGTCRFLVDQELHLHVNPAVLALEALYLRH